jgi:hypothetical protein
MAIYSPQLDFRSKEIKNIALQDYLWELENFTLDGGLRLPQYPEIAKDSLDNFDAPSEYTIGRLPNINQEYTDFLNFLQSPPDFDETISTFPDDIGEQMQSSKKRKVCFKDPIEEIHYIPNRFENTDLLEDEQLVKKRGRPLGSVQTSPAIVEIKSVEQIQDVCRVKRKIYKPYVFAQDPEQYFNNIPTIIENNTVYYNIQQAIKPVSSHTNMSRVAKKYHSKDPNMFIKRDTTNKKLNFVTSIEGLKTIFSKLTRKNSFHKKQVEYIEYVLQL